MKHLDALLHYIFKFLVKDLIVLAIDICYLICWEVKTFWVAGS